MITREELAARIYERSIHNEKKVKDAQNRAEKFGNPHNHKRPVGIELAHMAFNAAEDFLTVMRVRSKNPIPQQAVKTEDADGNVVYVEGGVGYRMGVDLARDGEDKTVDWQVVSVPLDAPKEYPAAEAGPDAIKIVIPPVLDAADAFRKRREELDTLERSFEDEFMIGGATDVPKGAMTGRVSAPLERFTPTAKTLDQNAAKKWQEANPKAIKGAAQNPAFKSDPKGPFWFISDGEGRKYQRWTKDGFAQHFGPHFVAGTLETEAAMLKLCPVSVRAFAAFIS